MGYVKSEGRARLQEYSAFQFVGLSLSCKCRAVTV